MPSDKKLRKKIEKYEKRLHRLNRKRRELSRSRSRSRSCLRQDPSPFSNPPSDAPEYVDEDCNDVEEVVEATLLNEATLTQQSPHCPDEGKDTVAAFRDALGVEYEDSTKFEGLIQNEITKRWNHILVNGLTKDERDNILKKYKLPENCQLLEAPVLNEEIKSVMTESSKLRDRSLEMVQHQLGMATAIVGQVMTLLIENKETDKIQLVTKLTDASKLFNDINFQKTRTRRLLISPLLEKNFNNLIEKVKRDEHLYGIDLGSKIKTSQELKKSSLQIKKTIPRPIPIKPTPKYKAVGNRYGPPQTQPSQQFRAAAPRGGPRSRTTQPPPHRAGHRHNYSHSRPERAAPRGLHSKR